MRGADKQPRERPSLVIAQSISPAFRAAMTAHLNRWQSDYGTLVVKAIRARPRSREDLTRKLDDLLRQRERVGQLLDTLSAASNHVEWEATRAAVEQAFEELKANTQKLRRQIRAASVRKSGTRRAQQDKRIERLFQED